MTQPNPDCKIPQGKTLVTGATGHVGANLVALLLEQGVDVRALVEPGCDRRAVDGLPIEVVQGDIRDAESVAKAVTGCARVYHVAAKVSTLSPSAGEQRSLYDINVIGTRNVMRGSLDAGVGRVVLTGSFSATGYEPDDPSRASSEARPFYPFGEVMPYAHTKALAEHETLKAVVDGLDAVIATSTACVGPNDFLPSRMGSTMCDFAAGKLRAYIPGGFEFVRARDLVQGHVLAMERGRRGNKYIFATQFHTLEDLVHMWSEALGMPPVKLKVPAGLMASVTGMYSGALSKFFPNLPQRLTPGAISVLRMRRHADTTKAQTELGWRPSDLRTAVIEAYHFFARESMISRTPVVAVPAGRTDTATAAQASA